MKKNLWISIMAILIVFAVMSSGCTEYGNITTNNSSTQLVDESEQGDTNVTYTSEAINIVKLDGNILTISYDGNPENVKIGVFSKENGGKDVIDNSHFLGEAFLANEHEWMFVFDAEDPLPKMIMAQVVYKVPQEREDYQKRKERIYIALDIKSLASLQKS